MGKKARESAQIMRARKKIEKQLQATENRMNIEALAHMRALIEKQIQRQAPERINLKKRQIVLFDENRHPAETQSKFVMHLLEKIKEGKPAKEKLKGRIKSFGTGTK
jgi:hypothetical protein